ncbi:MAG TPA: TatD family hydrolase [Lacunisphaera sp.]|nr:TatD family hydrolase [Lacunisphaera sp.]
MGLIDTHTHLDSYARRGELPATLQRAAAAGLEGMVAIGTDTDDWDFNRRVARENRGVVYYTVGLHPCNVGADWAGRVAQLETFWSGSGLRPDLPVALGETGLDRFHLPKDPAEAETVIGWQKAAFNAQLALAKKLGCPLVIHSRNAFPECVAMIDAAGIDWGKVVFHCFSEGPAEMAELMKRGGYGSFTGVVTYKNAESVRAALLAQGLDRLMVETDAPYLAPMPHRGKPNEPAFVRHTAEYCATLLGVSYERLAGVTTANARRFFGL